MPNPRSSYDDRPQRAGRKGVTTYLPEAIAKKLKLMAVQNDTTIQQITEDALVAWMEQHSTSAEVDTPAPRAAVKKRTASVG